MSDNTFLDKILAIIALLVLAAFLSVLIYYVPQPALTAVCVIVVLMAAVDFVRMAFLGKL
jgi:hypothetical protein